jgi:hypothetical protein
VIARRTLTALIAAAALLVLPAAAQADFGLAPGSVSITARNANGTIDEQASSHPYSFTAHFALNLDQAEKTEGGELRTVLADLPPGFIGNPTLAALPRCSRQAFEGEQPQCPPETQVGVLRAAAAGVGQIRGPLYNLVPPPGVAAQLGFSTIGFNSLQYASVRSEEGYGLLFSAPDLPIEVKEVTETIWGTPADPSHDEERTCFDPVSRNVIEGCASSAPRLPFLTMPAQCEAPLETRIEVDSKRNPGVFTGETVKSLNGAEQPAALSGCDAVPFNPEISSQPSSKLASNPSGLDFGLTLHNLGLLSPGGIVETEPKKVVVTLPQGVSINPSLAEGIGTCSEAQYKAEQLQTAPGQGCPEASKIGSVLVHSPLLEEPLEGSLYLASPYANKFGTLGALYMVARAPERGVLVKQAGKVEFNQSTGQITSTFEDLPPVPFSDFKLHFREGARAPLVTPQSCGEYLTTATLTPFSSNTSVQRSASFQITHGATGGACPSGGLPPFKPGLLAGSISAGAGKFSPFYIDLTRTDEEQEITHFSIKLPPGVVAKLAGVPFCPEAGIAQAKARERVSGAGQAELNAPSCPAASRIGSTEVGVGVGTTLTYVDGSVYLAGPYHGSALSVVAIVPAVVGPFDLGTVVVRQALKVEPETGEVFVDATGSDPIPHIVAGIPVHARDIGVHIDKPEFTLNPTGCKLTSTASTVLGSGLDFASEADDRPVTVSSPFQAVNCALLPFKPKLALKLKGGTRRGSYPALTAKLNMSGFGEAGIQRTQVTLPSSEFVAQSHFNTICTRVQFKQGIHPGEKCPAGSVYGYAKVATPILSEPLEGPVFLRSSEHQLPDVVAAVHNGEIDVVLDGKVDSVKGKLRTTFEATPDAPVSSVLLSLRGGKKGLFENSTNLCASTHKAEANFTGHNGKVAELKPVLKPLGCKGKAKKQKRRK